MILGVLECHSPIANLLQLDLCCVTDCCVGLLMMAELFDGQQK